jgi:hypothetical protein
LLCKSFKEMSVCTDREPASRFVERHETAIQAGREAEYKDLVDAQMAAAAASSVVAAMPAAAEGADSQEYMV